MARSFTFYSTVAANLADGSTGVSLSEDEYEHFVRDAIDPKILKSPLKYQEMVRVFITVNLEEDKTTDESIVNNDIRLMMSEFLEAVLRISRILHGKPCGGRASACLEAFLDDALPRLPRAALEDSNLYLRVRLYLEPVSAALEPHLKLFNAVWTVYGLKNATKRQRGMNKAGVSVRFSLEAWARLMQGSGMFEGEKAIEAKEHSGAAAAEGGHHGEEDGSVRSAAGAVALPRSDAKLVFLQSRMLVTNEYNMEKATTLTFVDFLEAFCRLADFKAAHGLKGPYGYPKPLHEAVANLVPVFFTRLAKTHGAVLKIECKGHSLDGKKVASLAEFLGEGGEV